MHMHDRAYSVLRVPTALMETLPPQAKSEVLYLFLAQHQ